MYIIENKYKISEVTMTKTNEFISRAESLPIDIRIQLIDTLLNSIHPSQKEIDILWAKEAEKRVEEIKTGKVKTIPGENIFKEIQSHFSKRNILNYPAHY